MIIVNINPGETYARVAGLWQYDYGQVLRIQGLSLPPAIEIHFSLQETGGEAITRIGVTKDGVTDVVIPDSILDGAGAIEDYFAYAFIYPSDESSGQTEHRIEIGVKSRPKPEGYKGSGDDTMGAVMNAINEIAAGKADGLEYKNSILRLMSGETELAQVTISGGSGGENGITPHIGENGNWYLGEADTGVKASGSDGITPHIGDNGNWYIGETDTGVKAEAPSIDSTLTESGKAADAKITGEKISELKGDLENEKSETSRLIEPLVEKTEYKFSDIVTAESVGEINVDYPDDNTIAVTIVSKPLTYTPVFIKNNGNYVKNARLTRNGNISGIIIAKDENGFVCIDRGYIKYNDGNNATTIGNIEYTSSTFEYVDISRSGDSVILNYNDGSATINESVLLNYEPCVGFYVFYNNNGASFLVKDDIKLIEYNPLGNNIKDTIEHISKAVFDESPINSKTDSLLNNQLFRKIESDSSITITDNIEGYGFVNVCGKLKILGDRVSSSPATAIDCSSDFKITVDGNEFQLSGINLYSEGNERDTLESNGIHRRIRKYVLTGKESISSYKNLGTNSRFFLYFGSASMYADTSADIICTHSGVPLASQKPSTDNECIYHVSESYCNVSFANSTLGIVESDTSSEMLSKCKDWIKSQYDYGTPVTIYYKLKTEVIEPYNNEQKSIIENICLQKFDKNTHTILVEAEETPIIEALCPMNLTKKFNELEFGGGGDDIQKLLATKVDNETEIDPNWVGWTKRLYPYGYNKNTARVFHELLGSIKTSGMFISQCSEDNRWNYKNFPNGGHVFEGWAVDGKYRLTMLLINKTDDGLPRGALQVFSPELGTFGWLKIGSDNNNPDGFSEGGRGWDFNCDMTVAHTPLVLATTRTPTKMPGTNNGEDIPLMNGTMYFDQNEKKVKVYIDGVWKNVKFED